MTKADTLRHENIKFCFLSEDLTEEDSSCEMWSTLSPEYLVSMMPVHSGILELCIDL